MLAFFALLPVALTWEAAAPDSDYSYRFVQPGPEEALAGVFVLVSIAAALTPLPASRWTWAAARSLAWGGAIAALLLQIVPVRASTSSDPWIGLFDWGVTWGLGLAAAVGALLWSAPAEAWLAEQAPSPATMERVP